jgi:hypothetical protein
MIRALCQGRRVRPLRISAGNVTEPTLEIAKRRECRTCRGWASTSYVCDSAETLMLSITS